MKRALVRALLLLLPRVHRRVLAHAAEAAEGVADAGWSTPRASSAAGDIGPIAVIAPGAGLASSLVFVLNVYSTPSRITNKMHPESAPLFPVGAGAATLVQYMSAADHARVMISIYNVNLVDMHSPIPMAAVSAGRRGAFLSGLQCLAAFASARPLTQGLVRPSTNVP